MVALMTRSRLAAGAVVLVSLVAALAVVSQTGSKLTSEVAPAAAVGGVGNAGRTLSQVPELNLTLIPSDVNFNSYESSFVTGGGVKNGGGFGIITFFWIVSCLCCTGSFLYIFFLMNDYDLPTSMPDWGGGSAEVSHSTNRVAVEPEVSGVPLDYVSSGDHMVTFDTVKKPVSSGSGSTSSSFSSSGDLNRGGPAAAAVSASGTAEQSVYGEFPVIRRNYLEQLLEKPTDSGRHLMGHRLDDKYLAYYLVPSGEGPSAATGGLSTDDSFRTMTLGLALAVRKSKWGKNFDIVQIWIPSALFNALLENAVHSVFMEEVYSSVDDWEAEFQDADVTVSWVWERDLMSNQKLERRNLEISLKGPAIDTLRGGVLAADDITPFVAGGLHANIMSGAQDTPIEEELSCPSHINP